VCLSGEPRGCTASGVARGPQRDLEITMKVILFPTDFSDHAALALPHAINFAALEGAELHILHVVVLHGSDESDGEARSGEAQARAALDGLGHGASRVVRATRRAVAAAPAILDYADENGVDLIVMGSHGRRGLRRLLLGSVTEEVIRAGTWPVLTVRGEHDHGPTTTNYGRIVAPVDFSSSTPEGLETAADLARRFSAELELIHIVDVPILPELYGPVTTPVVDVKRATDQAAEKLEQLAGPLRADLSVSTDVHVGGAVHEILKAAEGADLIVLPTHGYSGLDRMLMGSVAEGVLRRATCPVLTVKTAVE